MYNLTSSQNVLMDELNLPSEHRRRLSSKALRSVSKSLLDVENRILALSNKIGRHSLRNQETYKLASSRLSTGLRKRGFEDMIAVIVRMSMCCKLLVPENREDSILTCPSGWSPYAQPDDGTQEVDGSRGGGRGSEC